MRCCFELQIKLFYKEVTFSTFSSFLTKTKIAGQNTLLEKIISKIWQSWSYQFSICAKIKDAKKSHAKINGPPELMELMYCLKDVTSLLHILSSQNENLLRCYMCFFCDQVSLCEEKLGFAENMKATIS